MEPRERSGEVNTTSLGVSVTLYIHPDDPYSMYLFVCVCVHAVFNASLCASIPTLFESLPAWKHCTTHSSPCPGNQQENQTRRLSWIGVVLKGKRRYHHCILSRYYMYCFDMYIDSKSPGTRTLALRPSPLRGIFRTTEDGGWRTTGKSGR